MEISSKERYYYMTTLTIGLIAAFMIWLWNSPFFVSDPSLCDMAEIQVSNIYGERVHEFSPNEEIKVELILDKATFDGKIKWFFYPAPEYSRGENKRENPVHIKYSDFDKGKSVDIVLDLIEEDACTNLIKRITIN